MGNGFGKSLKRSTVTGAKNLFSDGDTVSNKRVTVEKWHIGTMYTF
jgi:hypothetical protein